MKKWGKEHANLILELFRGHRLNSYLVGSIATTGRGNDIDIVILDAPKNWKDIVTGILSPYQVVPNDWNGAKFFLKLFEQTLEVDVMILNPKEGGIVI